MIAEIPLTLLTPSKLNPRQHFDEAALAELTENIRHHGVLSNLIVRPDWCAGLITGHQLNKAAEAAGVVMPTAYEIVSGERRFRAARAAAIAEVPVRVKAMTDPEVLAINLSEQMQRNELTPLEEADAFSRLLAYKDEKGVAMHTAESLAASVGKAHDYVLRRLKLLALPATLKKALNSGKVSPTVADLVARVPDPASREAAAEEVLTGGRDGKPMLRDDVQAMLNEKFMVELKGAPFDQEDELLVPAAGKCSACPHRTGNNKAVFGDVRRGDVCTNPFCYRQKCQAAFAQVADVANRMGVKVLSDKESEKLFETHRPTEVRFNCDWVELDTRPMAHLLKEEVKNPPVWRELLEKALAAGMKPQVVLAKDGAGRGRWLVEAPLLMAAAEKLGEPIFRGQKEDETAVEPREGEDGDDAFRRGKREHAEKQKKAALAEAERLRQVAVVRTAALKAVHSELAAQWVPVEIWSVMMEMLLREANVPVWHLLADMFGLKRESTSKQIRDAVAKATDLKRTDRLWQALVPLLLGSQAILEQGIDNATLVAFARMAGVNLKQVEKEALRSLEPVEKSKKPKGAAAKAVAAVKGSSKPKGKPAKRAGKGDAK